MKNLFILFDKNLVVPKPDYDVFQKENYSIDDGSFHLFMEEHNALLVLDKYKKPVFSVCFKDVTFRNEQRYEIDYIHYELDTEIDPVNNNPDAQDKVLNIIIKVFSLLDEIISKRTKDIKCEAMKYDYILHDRNNHKFDMLVLFNQRTSYLQLLHNLAYLFYVT